MPTRLKFSEEIGNEYTGGFLVRQQKLNSLRSISVLHNGEVSIESRPGSPDLPQAIYSGIAKAHSIVPTTITRDISNKVHVILEKEIDDNRHTTTSLTLEKTPVPLGIDDVITHFTEDETEKLENEIQNFLDDEGITGEHAEQVKYELLNV